jgi:hypothetical protein
MRTRTTEKRDRKRSLDKRDNGWDRRNREEIRDRRVRAWNREGTLPRAQREIGENLCQR